VQFTNATFKKKGGDKMRSSLRSRRAWALLRAGIFTLSAGVSANAEMTLHFLTAEPPEVYAAPIAALEKLNPGIKVAYERGSVRQHERADPPATMFGVA
jgi:hypothetical protein